MQNVQTTSVFETRVQQQVQQHQPQQLESASESVDAERKEDFIPVREKAKMIALQQEEILRREEEAKQEGRVRAYIL